MTLIRESVWNRLNTEHTSGETLWARRASDATERLLAALDADGRRHFLVRLEPSEAGIQDLQSRGVSIFTHELEGRTHEPGMYVDIVCVESSGHDAFDLIGSEIADRIATGREVVSECVSRVVAKWRRFWDHPPGNILSKQSQVGLFAEIWFLHFWLIPARGISAAVSSWRGAFGSRHDFEWEGRSVEVKATLAGGAAVHKINGLDQLAPPEEGDLLLFSLQLREERGATNNLPTLIRTCREVLAADSAALGHFEDALVHIGYSTLHESQYDNLRLRAVAQGLFQVRDDFPRMTHETFPGGLPKGVGGVEYEITLFGLDHLCLARQPADYLQI